MTRKMKLMALATVLALTLALSVFAGLAGAHSKVTTAGMILNFGGTDEPVITGMRSWMQVTIADEISGEAVQGLAENDALTLTISNGEWSRKVTLSAVRGEPGAYRAPVWFTVAGKYDFIVQGTKADGTAFEAKWHKDIADHRELFFPPVVGN